MLNTDSFDSKTAPIYFIVLNQIYQTSSKVRLELLSASLKLFFQRPPEMQAMLGRLFAFLLDSEDLDPDLSDRTMFYYRLLKTDPQKCKRIIAPTRDPVDTFTEDEFDEIKEEILRQFNTLAVLYGVPAYRFTDNGYLTLDQGDEDEGGDDMGGMANNDSNAAGATIDASAEGSGEMLGFSNNQNGQVATSEAAGQSNVVSSGGGDDLLGLLGFDNGGGSNGAGTSPSFELIDTGNALSQAEFQQSWMNPQATASQQVFTSQVGGNLELSALENRLRAKNVMTLASGAPGGNIKAYLYGHSAAGVIYFCELIVSQAGNAQGTVKSSTAQADESLTSFASIVEGCLAAAPAAAQSSAVDDILGLF